MKTVLSGIQPSGKLHLGNYFGAMRQHLAFQETHECYYFIANYHALTSLRNRNLLRQYTLDVALDYLALGLNPSKVAFYRQSDLPEVTELAWILTTLTPMGLLERCHSYKDKIAKGLAPEHGLFAYPVLMAADILVVNADLVPVGKDQKQHLEVTRDIAQKFNHTYGKVFTLPEPYIPEETAVVPGIDGQKMSKTYGNTIDLFDEPENLRRKVFSIVTDSLPVEAPKDPETNIVFQLLKLFIDPEEKEEWEKRFTRGGLKYSDLKKRLYEKIVETFQEAWEKRRYWESRKEEVEEIWREGAKKARKKAKDVLNRVREACGLSMGDS